MGSILYEYTPQELQALLDTSVGYADLLRKVGLNPKGSNPDTLKKIIKEYDLDDKYGLPRRVKDIKSYSDDEWNNI